MQSIETSGVLLVVLPPLYAPFSRSFARKCIPEGMHFFVQRIELERRFRQERERRQWLLYSVASRQRISEDTDFGGGKREQYE